MEYKNVSLTTSILSKLSPILSFGTEYAASDEKQRIVLTNIVCYFTLFFNLEYAAIYLFKGWDVALVTNMFANILFVFILVLNRKGWNKLAPILCFIVLCAELCAFSLFIFGPTAGFHYFLFIVPPMAMLTIARSNTLVKITLTVSSIILFVISEYFPFREAYLIEIPESYSFFFHVSSTTGAIGSQTIAFLLFHSRLAHEHTRSESLLLNILPASIAKRLKESTKTLADTFSDTSILFADIVGFTEFSTGSSPDEVVSLLNKYFTAFDDLTTKHNLEKIKTIGDAYMVASGIPTISETHAEDIMNMAIDMLKITSEIRSETRNDMQIRIGINSGNAVAGVIGKKKFTYDLWGDTVNIASRMESNGLPGRIQVTEKTYDLLKNKYEFECRGPMTIKGKGEMNVYLLKTTE
ncbi:adenylate/guanylate cyclase domain-containing protein [Nitrospirota bacterium]